MESIGDQPAKKELIVEGEASESDGEENQEQPDGCQDLPAKPEPIPEKQQHSRFSKLSQMGQSMSSAVTSAVEKQLSAYLPANKEDPNSSTKGSENNFESASTVQTRILNKASSLAAEMLPFQMPSAEAVSHKSLLHEKLYEKNSSIAKTFSMWTNENYNQKIPKLLEDMLHHLGVTTQIELQESVLAIQQVNHNSLEMLAALEETKLLSDSIPFPCA